MEKGKWITVRGRHIFIPEGQTLDDVLNNKDNRDYEVDTADEEEIKKAQSEDKYEDDLPVKKYEPKTKIEKEVDSYVEKHWDTLKDSDMTLGELAYKISGYVRAPQPVLMDALSKSIGSRKLMNKNKGQIEEYTDFRKDYSNHKKISEEEFKNKFNKYEKDKGGFEYYSSGNDKGYTLHDKDGTTIGYYDLNDNMFHFENKINDLEASEETPYKDKTEDEYDNLSNILKEYNVEIKPTPTYQSKYQIKSNKLPFVKREEINKKLESLGYEVHGDGNGNLNIWNSLNENQYNNKRNDWIINDFLNQYGYKEKLSPDEKAVIAKILKLK